jgi:hypothetical protein
VKIGSISDTRVAVKRMLCAFELAPTFGCMPREHICRLSQHNHKKKIMSSLPLSIMPEVAREVTADSFLLEAMEMGVEREQFRDFCGISPDACKVLWQSCNLNDKEPKHVVWTLLYLKRYQYEADAALAHVAETTQQNYQDCIWETIDRMHTIYPSVVASRHENINDLRINDRMMTWGVFPISTFRHDGFSYVKCFNAVAVCEIINSILDDVVADGAAAAAAAATGGGADEAAGGADEAGGGEDTGVADDGIAVNDGVNADEDDGVTGDEDGVADDGVGIPVDLALLSLRPLTDQELRFMHERGQLRSMHELRQEFWPHLRHMHELDRQYDEPIGVADRGYNGIGDAECEVFADAVDGSEYEGFADAVDDSRNVD